MAKSAPFDPRPTPRRKITLDEFFNLPDDGVNRYVIDGYLYEEGEGPGVTRRSFLHTETQGYFAAALIAWLRQQPEPRGRVLSGGLGVVLRDEPMTSVAVDVAVVSAEQIAHVEPERGWLWAAPLLAIDLLSSDEKLGTVHEREQLLFQHGTRAIWMVNPYARTVVVRQPSESPRIYAGADELSGDPYLPGFLTPVRDLFQP